MVDEDGNKTIASLLPFIRKAMIHMTWLVTVPHTIYMYIRGSSPDTLGLTMWTPFDSRPSPLHEIIIAIQVSVLTLPNSGFLSVRLIPEGSTLLKLNLATGHDPEPDLSNPHPHNLLTRDPFH
jgi:hypothetical protein